MDKQALKLLAQAVRQHKPQDAPVDETTLPTLPDLSFQLTPQNSLQLNQPTSTGNLSLDRHGINFKSDDIQAQLTPEKIQAQIAVRDALVKALYNRDGNASVSASMPVMGGTLDMGVGRNQGNNSYNLKYQKNF